MNCNEIKAFIMAHNKSSPVIIETTHLSYHDIHEIRKLLKTFRRGLNGWNLVGADRHSHLIFTEQLLNYTPWYWSYVQ